MTIFVSIASYRDPELTPTVLDCLAKACEPDGVRFGICWQHGDDEEIPALQGDIRIRIDDVDWRESRGACWARARTFGLYDGEDYYLQIDSHHRFARAWDERLIAALHSTECDKPLMTAYCPAYTPGESYENVGEPQQINFHYFTDEGIPLYRPRVIQDWRNINRPVRARFVSAHFLFTIGSFVKEVPYDSELYFHGEEIMLAVRAYTHGYDLFHPSEVLLWHEYTREYRLKHWDDHVPDNGVDVPWYRLDEVSKDRVRRTLVAPESGSSLLGDVQSIAQYEKYAGISFGHRKVQDYTLFGLEPPNPAVNDDWHLAIRLWRGHLEIDLAALPSLTLIEASSWHISLYGEPDEELFVVEVERRILDAAINGKHESITFTYAFHAGMAPRSWVLRAKSTEGGWLPETVGECGPSTNGAMDDALEAYVVNLR